MKKVFISFSGLLLSASVAFGQADSLRLIDLQEVQVVSTRASSQTPMTFSTVTKSDLQQQNTGQDIPFLLSLTPSVVATSDAGNGVGYTGIRIRGTDANRINVTANGVPINDSESHGVFWVNMPDFASSLQDIQIQRGVGTSTNGAAAFGGSLNMKTENLAIVPYAELHGSYGAFNTSKLTVKAGSGLLRDRWAFDARLSTIKSDGFIDRASTDLSSYFVQGGYFGKQTVIKLLSFGGKEQTYHAWDGVPKDKLQSDRTYNPSGYMGDDVFGNPMYYDNQTDNYQQTHYHLLLNHSFSSSLSLNMALHYTKGKGYYEEYKTDRKLKEYGLSSFVFESETITKSDLVRQKHLDNDFGGAVFSLDYAMDKLSVSWGGGANYYTGDHFGKITWIKNYAGDAAFMPGKEYYTSVGEKTDANTYLKATYAVTNSLNLYGDVQYRYINYQTYGTSDRWEWMNNQMQVLDINEDFHFFNPKAGVFYTFDTYSSAYASVAVGHREPTRNNYKDAELTANPTFERLINYELGYAYKQKNYAFGANAYYMDYKNQLVLTGKVNEIGEALTSNTPESYRVGIELTAGVHITPWLQWNGNLTISENIIKNYTKYVDLYDENWDWSSQVATSLGDTPISFSPNVIANSVFSINHNGWSAAFQSSYVGKQYIDNSGNDERSLSAYFVNNARLGYTFTLKGLKELGIGILCNNILNEQYESNAWVYSFYQQPDMNNPHTDRYADFGYFPQAGRNLMLNMVLKF
jgi:iron complex outermembrane recepter protein